LKGEKAMTPEKINSNFWNIHEGEKIFDPEGELILTGPLTGVRIEYFEGYPELASLQTPDGRKFEVDASQFPTDQS
jgi:hypothetical protein